MGIVIVGMLLGWALLSLIVGLLGAPIVQKIIVLGSVKRGVLRLVIALIFGASPFLYWNYRIASFGELWAEECEERTHYVLHNPPPLDFVYGIGSSWNDNNWKKLTQTDIRSFVVEDEPDLGLSGQKGKFVLELAPSGAPDCALFHRFMASRSRNTDYLQGQCIGISPLQENTEIHTIERRQGALKMLHENGTLSIYQRRVLLQNIDTQEIYAEFVEVDYRHPKLTDNLFVSFATLPSCKKLELLKQNKLYSNPYKFAFSSEFRSRLENLNNGLY